MAYSRESIEGRFLAGDVEAVGTVSRWIATVLTDLRYWGMSAEWPDLHQDALMGVLASLRRGRFDAERDFRSYVMAVARFIARRARRRLRRRGADDPSPLESMASGAEVSAEAAALRSLALRRAVAALQAPCRELIEAYFFAQRDAEEIAVSQGIPVGTVKSRLFRCLAQAREELRRRGKMHGIDGRTELRGHSGQRDISEGGRLSTEPES